MSFLRYPLPAIALAALFAVPLTPCAAQRSSPEKSIIRVNATLQDYSFLRPWEKGAPTPRRGLGAVLKGNRVLITSEMCVNSTFLELEHPSSGARVPARIVGIDYEANLAVLEPANTNSKVFDGLEALELDNTVLAGDTLKVWQVEDNGDGVSTDVEVLRVDVGRYFIPGSVFLLYQVKGSLQARVNSFTLPVVKDGKLAGLLLSYSSKEQTAGVLPSPIIKAFLADLEDGDYKGFPNLGINFAQTLDETFREFTGLKGRDGGIYVEEVAKGGSADKAGIKEGDVILSIGGQTIDSRGNYSHPTYGKLSFSHLVRGSAKTGDVIKLDIIRDSKPLSLDVTLIRKFPSEYLIDPYMFDRGPKYVIFGGLIFQELTLPYLESWGEEWTTRAPFKLVHANSNPHPFEEEGREKLVFLSNVLKTPSTLGYEAINSVIVTKVNGTFIKNIEDLSAAFAAVPKDGLHTIEFPEYPKVIYVDDKASRLINQELIKYGISQLERLE
ncbi:MAG: PDZ domain-containing protein [Verrucomicrobiales bacterium]|nr:PDZ domain-containing protein [Verrucomicrobiales bacterium]HQW28938.1 PDZ domain-containing protein [Verrucomicrobiales bacterium]